MSLLQKLMKSQTTPQDYWRYSWRTDTSHAMGWKVHLFQTSGQENNNILNGQFLIIVKISWKLNSPHKCEWSIAGNLQWNWFWYHIHSLSIPPGTKVCLTGTITVQESFLMLDSNNTRVLGGEVEKLKEKWELNKVINYWLSQCYTFYHWFPTIQLLKSKLMLTMKHAKTPGISHL